MGARFCLGITVDALQCFPAKCLSMHAVLSAACISCLVCCFTHQSLSQIGETKEELVQRYGPCQPNPAWRSEGAEHTYRNVIDFGEDCTFRTGQYDMTVLFKDGKAVVFDYRVELPFSASLVSGDRWQKLSALDILRLQRMTILNAHWVDIPSDSTIQRSRTKDSTVFAYYFAGGHYKRHHFLVQTAAVDAVFKKAELPLVKPH